jgi:predicted RNA binding protein YcfA (HicA-like mRNA interferase family)
MKVRDVLKRLHADGGRLVRQKGSHRHLQHDRNPGTVTVPGKPNDDLHPKTVLSILRQAPLQEET